MTVKPVIVVGDANVDLVIRLPDPKTDLMQPVPQLFGGGSAANTAVALAWETPRSFGSTMGLRKIPW